VQLLLVRHAEPKRVEGLGAPADPTLTALGRKQSAALATWLADEPIDHVVSSPLRRAVETARPLAIALGLDVEVLDGLAEWDRESDSYIPVEELRETKDERWQLMVEERWEEMEGGVDPNAFRAAVMAAAEDVISRFPSRSVVAICHGGVINAYLGSVLGLSRVLWFHPEYTSISRVAASSGGIRSIVSLNETGHLRGIGA
jgi:broad specificity phosphatase PhoE